MSTNNRITEEDTRIEAYDILISAGFKRKDMKFEKQGKTGPSDIRIYYPYRAIVEVKPRGTPLDHTVVEQGIRYASDWGKADIVYITNGGEVLGYNPVTKKPYMVNGTQVRSYLTEIVEDGYIEPLPIKHTKGDLICLFKWAENYLRDKEGLNVHDRCIAFAYLLFVKLVSSAKHVNLPAYAKFENIANKEDAQEIYDTITNRVWPHLEKVYGGVFGNSGLIIKNPEVVKTIIKRLAKFDFDQIDIDIKGECFEYFLRNEMVGGDLGQYFTPRPVVSYIASLANIKVNDIIYDPACGTGGFLIVGFKEQLKQINNNDEESIKRIKKNLHGGEFNGPTCRIAKMNMILAGDGHGNIKKQDTLLQNPRPADKILANVPFGTATTAFETGKYPIKSKKGESLFVQHILMSLNPDGTAVIIVPNGLLFRREDLLLRKWVTDHYKLEEIIALPKGIFTNTGIGASILVITTGKTEIIKHRNYITKESYSNVHISQHENTWLLPPKDVKRNAQLEYKPIGNLFNITKGNKKARGNEKGEYPLFTSSMNVKSININTHNLTAILIGGGGKANINFVDGKFAASRDVFILEKKEDGFITKYVYYYLLTNLHILEALFRGSGLNHLTKENLINIQIPMESLEKQKNMVADAEKYEKISKNLAKHIENIDAKRIDIFKNLG